jgi:hypothetical protein
MTSHKYPWIYDDEELVKRAVHSARPPQRERKAARWVCVMYSFGVGSTVASNLCRRFDLNPDEEIGR